MRARRNSYGDAKQPFQRPSRFVLCAGLVFLVPASGVGFEIQRKPLADNELVQRGLLALDGANADMPAPVRGQPEILAADRAAADQFDQLVARFDAAGPCVGVLVDAHLVELRRIDAVEPIGHAGQLKGAAVLDDRAGSPAWAGPEKCQYQD